MTPTSKPAREPIVNPATITRNMVGCRQSKIPVVTRPAADKVASTAIAAIWRADSLLFSIPKNNKKIARKAIRVVPKAQLSCILH